MSKEVEDCGEGQPHKGPKHYNDEFDSYYCLNCNCWTEDVCGSDVCGPCKDRPEFPIGKIRY